MTPSQLRAKTAPAPSVTRLRALDMISVTTQPVLPLWKERTEPSQVSVKTLPPASLTRLLTWDETVDHESAPPGLCLETLPSGDRAQTLPVESLTRREVFCPTSVHDPLLPRSCSYT